MTDIRAAAPPPTPRTPTEQGAAHTHAAARVARGSRRARRLTLSVLIPAILLTAAGVVWLWPGPSDREPWTGPPQVSGQVISVNPATCPETPETPDGFDLVCGTVAVRVTGGADNGKEITTDIPSGPGAPTVQAGDRVVMIYLADSPTGNAYQIIDHRRGTQLWLLVAAFALAVIAFGRWRGLSALAGLAITFGVLLLFVVPAILDGQPPLLVAIVGSAAIMLVVLYLTHGFGLPTSMAVLGTLISLTLTGLLAGAATAATRLTGVGSEDSSFLTIAFRDVNMQGLLLAGILIGSLGVLDDITVTQAYTVNELAAANPAARFRQLYRAATRVGRAHIASVINTLVLAYAGASLPLLLLLAAGSQPLGQMLTSQFMAEEIVRSIVGTLGLIAAVPLTTGLAALAAVRGSASVSGVEAAPAADGVPPARRARRPAPPRCRRRRLDDLEVAWGVADDEPDDGRLPRRLGEFR